MKKMSKKTVLSGLFLAIIVIISLGFFFKQHLIILTQKAASLITTLDKTPGYIVVDPTTFEISTFAEGLASPTRIKITPSGNYLLVAQISGEIFSFKRLSKGWDNTPSLLTTAETHFPGFPAEEGGLVGMVFSADFNQNSKLFLLYSYQDEQGIKNRIAVTTLQEIDNKLTAAPPIVIFEANTPGNVSHQITDGLGILIQNKPHLLFLIGEGFKAQRAQDQKLESGKAMIIGEDGGDPIGIRPYPETPKIQAIGLRNGYVLTENIYQGQGRVLLTDTGPDKFDRLITSQLFEPQGKASNPINFGWDGSEEKLLTPIPDPNQQKVADMVLMRLPTTLTFAGLAIHPGKGTIPVSNEKTQSLLMTMFGKTGSTTNEPGKEIWLGTLNTSANQPTATARPIIKRNPVKQDTLGNPLGLEIDSRTGDFFFADIFEGKIYKVTIKE